MPRMTKETIYGIFCFCACALMLLAATGAARGQSFADGFDPNPDNAVSVIAAQPNGKILVGGFFTSIGGAARSTLARLNSDGRLDASFAPDIDASVFEIVVQPDDKILLGGTFTIINGQTQSRIARLNADGSLDASFNPVADNRVSAIALQPDGKILISGLFTAINGQIRNRIARLNADGTLDVNFNPNVDGTVGGLVLQPNGKIVISGSFLNVGGTARNRIARLNADGSVDVSFNPNANNLVEFLALQADGKILASGTFTSIGGIARSNFVRLNTDGTADASFAVLTSGNIRAFAAQPDGKILIGGIGIQTSGVTNSRTVLRFNRDGSVDANFVANTDNRVAAFAVQPDNKILIGGQFSVYEARRLDGTTGYTEPRSGIARLELDGNVDRTLTELDAHDVRAVLIQPDGKIVVGGGNLNFPFYVRRGAPDGAVEASFNVNPNGEVDALALQPDGKILVGGGFTQINADSANALARLKANGTIDPAFAPNFGSGNSTASIYAVLALPDGKVLAGGSFTSINNLTRSGIVRLKPDGNLDAVFSANTDGAVRSIAVQPDGKIVIGGDFTVVNGAARSRIARLDAASGAADDFSPTIDARVSVVGVQADGKIIAGGEFTSAGGATRTRIARFNADGSLDQNFNLTIQPFQGQTSEVNTLALQADGKIIIGGHFFRLNGNSPNPPNYINLARLNADGTPDTGFRFVNNNVSNILRCVALQADGKILAGFDTFLRRGSNPTAAVQTIDATRSDIYWIRGGASARLAAATFEFSTNDGANYTALGGAARIGTSDSFYLPNLNLPVNQNVLVRARGYYFPATNGGTRSIVESTRNFYFSVPVVAGDSYETNEDTALTVAAPGVLGNDASVDNSPLTAALAAPPIGGTVMLNSNGSFVYTPNANFNGADSFTYKANNGVNDSIAATVNITVNAVNDAPVAVGDFYGVKNSLTLNVAAPGVLANDTDIEATALTASLITATANGTLNLNSNGSFTYTPNQNFVGTDSFSYRANDGASLSNSAIVNITVTAPIIFAVNKVDDTNDNSCDAQDCSLREAIAAAEPGDIVQFAAPLFDSPQTITLSPTLQTLIISKTVTIAGRGANLLTVRRQPAAGRYGIFYITNGANVRLSGMTLTEGYSGGAGGAILNNVSAVTVSSCHLTGNTAADTGGAIYNSIGGTLTILNSAVTNNTAPGGQFGGAGGIHNQGTLVMTNSTVSGNSVTGSNPRQAGGVYTSDGSAIITASTVTDNQTAAATGAGGIYKFSGAAIIRSTIIAANRDNAAKPDVAVSFGEFTSSGYNLIGNVGTVTAFNQTGDQTGNSSFADGAIDSKPSPVENFAPAAVLDPRLAPLAPNGAAIPTHALRSGSPALDKGNAFGAIADQRGSLRPFDIAGIPNLSDGSDIGAYEAQMSPTAASVLIGGRIVVGNGRGLQNAAVTLTDQTGNTRTARSTAFGYFQFADISAGQTVVVQVFSKKYVFAPQAVFVTEDVSRLNFTAEP